MTDRTLLPITIRGYIAIEDYKPAVVRYEPFGWEYGPLPYVSPYGDDAQVALIAHETSTTVIADADTVEAIRSLVPIGLSLDELKWESTRGE